MRKFIKQFAVIVLTFVCVLLIGCSPEDVNTRKSVSDDNFTDDIINIDNSSVSAMLETTPNTIKKHLGNVVVNASVDVNKTDHIYVLRRSGNKKYDVSNLLKIFDIEGATLSEQIKEPDYDGYVYRKGKSEMYISYGKDPIYTHCSLDNDDMEKYNGALMFLKSDEDLKKVFNKENLNFMSRNSALGKAESILDALGIETAGEPLIYALDHKNLQKAQDENIKNPTFPAGAINQKGFSEEDDMYMMIFRGGYKGTPYTQSTYDIGDIPYDGEAYEICIDKNGLLFFGGRQRITERAEEIQSVKRLVTVVEAMDAIKMKYDNIIIGEGEKINIYQIRLEYFNRPDKKDEYRMVPTWCFAYGNDTQKGQSIGFSAQQSIRVDAVTGEIF